MMMTRSPRRTIFTAVAAVFAGASLLLAATGTVKTNDGRSLTGDIKEADGQVLITTKGGQLTIPRDQVASIAYDTNFEKEYADRYAKLATEDVAGRVELGRYAFEQKQYDRAREVLEEALRIEPANASAAEMLTIVRSQIRLGNAPPAVPPVSRPAVTDGTTQPAGKPPAPGDKKLVDADTINLIRQRELRNSDTGVRFQFANGVEQKFARFNNQKIADFRKLTPIERATDILGKGDDAMKADVKIVNDPAAIVVFRKTVQPLILNGCSTSSCHGGGAGGVIFYSPADNDAVSYTNFLTLAKFTKKVETNSSFGSGARAMIERGGGDRSLLANYLLSQDVAEVDHPAAGGYTGVVRSKDDQRYKAVVEWMNTGLGPTVADYANVSTTQPAKK